MDVALGRSRMASVLRSGFVRLLLAEFLGTFVFVSVTVGALAQVILSETSRLTNDALLSESFDPRMVVFLAEGLAFCLGLYVARGVSGGHLNPVISLALAVRGTLRWSHMLAAWTGQYLGAFLGMTAVYSIYHNAADDFISQDINRREGVASIFASHPQENSHWFLLFINVLLNSTLFSLLYFGLNDKRSDARRADHFPVALGLAITAIGLSTGFTCGTAINPAKSFSGSLFSAAARWDFDLVPGVTLLWFWIPVVTPHLGAVLGLVIYQAMIGNHWPPAQKRQTERRTSGALEGRILVRQNQVLQQFTETTEDVKVLS
ncbi:AQP1 [Ramazzottius varieornatus]|uniref:AQP1 n=1 Tax=Ramazzottius varieornatus TaxID=947166 RepID=A0A1D1W5D0_RAMVA|nr:AQP1 [Ramazzottius varieornatus]